MATLTAQQEAFCASYVLLGRGFLAYREAYDVSPTTLQNTCQQEASKLLADPTIAQRIAELRTANAIASATGVTMREVVAWLYDVATADPRELTGMKVGNCRHCHGQDHKYRWRDDEWAAELALAEKGKRDFPDWAGGIGWRPFHPPHPDCPECGGHGVPHPTFRDTDDLSRKALRLFAGVKMTKNGIEVMMHDQAKAWDNLCRILGGYADGLNVKLSADIPAILKNIKDLDPHTAAATYLDMVKTPVQ